MNLREINHKLYGKLNILTSASGAIILLAIWAFFEASIWFVIPDFLLLILCVFSPKKYKIFFITCILFSIVGISAYFLFTSQYLDISSKMLRSTPFLNENMLDRVDSRYNQEGVIAAIWQTTTVTPVKVWTFKAVEHKFNFFSYLLFIAISRAIRMLLVCIIFSYLGRRLSNFLLRNTVQFLLLYLVVFFFVLLHIT